MTIEAHPAFEQFDVRKFHKPPAELRKFLERLKSLSGQVEKRNARRFPTAFAALFLPLDESFNPAGPTFEAQVCNISLRGLALLHPTPLTVRYLAAQLAIPGRQPFELLLEVRRAIPADSGHEIGCRFFHPPAAD